MSMNDLELTVVGNLTDDPELRFTPSGAAVAQCTIAHNPKRLNRETGEWTDGDPSFVPVTLWREVAEHAAESLSRGDRVIAVGSFAEERWQDKDGNNRARWKLTAHAFGPDLRFATARPEKVRRGTVPPDDEFANASRERPADDTADASQ